jgi:hypothetical protein
MDPTFRIQSCVGRMCVDGDVSVRPYPEGKGVTVESVIRYTHFHFAGDGPCATSHSEPTLFNLVLMVLTSVLPSGAPPE